MKSEFDGLSAEELRAGIKEFALGLNTPTGVPEQKGVHPDTPAGGKEAAFDLKTQAIMEKPARAISQAERDHLHSAIIQAMRAYVGGNGK